VGQNSYTEDHPLQLALAEHGFEQVSTVASPNHLLVAFENRLYRSQAEALARVFQFIAESPMPDSLTVLLLSNSVPMLSVETTSADLKQCLQNAQNCSEWAASLNISRNNPEAEKKIATASVHNPIRFRPELAIGLSTRYRLGNFNNPYRFAFDLEPELRVPLLYGFSATARMVVPLYNYKYDNNTHIRLPLAALTWEGRPAPGLYAAASTGWFTRNRRGWQAQITWEPIMERLSLTADGGQSYFTSLSGRVTRPDLHKKGYSVWGITAALRSRTYGLEARLRYGTYLYSYKGWVASVDRQFNDATIGFFYIKTLKADNYGFRFTLPLLPKRGVKAGPVMIRADHHFPVSYRYGGSRLQARLPDAGIRLNQNLYQLNPSHIRRELLRYISN
jgi:hypothetical protein